MQAKCKQKIASDSITMQRQDRPAIIKSWENFFIACLWCSDSHYWSCRWSWCRWCLSILFLFCCFTVFASLLTEKCLHLCYVYANGSEMGIPNG